MDIYNILGVTLASLLYIYLFQQIRKGGVEQNLATWVSWGLLDIVAGVSLYVQGGNWYLLAIYIAGSLVISTCIFRSAKFMWGLTETVCSVLVVISIIMWAQSGPWYATIISTVGVAFATLPQLKDAIVNPSTSSPEVYIGFTVVNVLATVGGKAWTIEERLYPGVGAVLCVFIVLFSLRKYSVAEKPRGA